MTRTATRTQAACLRSVEAGPDARLKRLYARRDDMQAGLRTLEAAIRDEERRQSEALGYRVILRGPQLVEAINRRAG